MERFNYVIIHDDDIASASEKPKKDVDKKPPILILCMFKI